MNDFCFWIERRTEKTSPVCFALLFPLDIYGFYFEDQVNDALINREYPHAVVYIISSPSRLSRLTLFVHSEPFFSALHSTLNFISYWYAYLFLEDSLQNLLKKATQNFSQLSVNCSLILHSCDELSFDSISGGTNSQKEFVIPVGSWFLHWLIRSFDFK